VHGGARCLEVDADADAQKAIYSTHIDDWSLIVLNSAHTC